MVPVQKPGGSWRQLEVPEEGERETQLSESVVLPLVKKASSPSV